MIEYIRSIYVDLSDTDKHQTKGSSDSSKAHVSPSKKETTVQHTEFVGTD